MKKLNIQYGTASFRSMLEKKYLYIDKTERIYDLINSGERFFLSRPRRFGKTLLVDILEEIFKGNKELFKGLAIYDKDYEWKSYPVIRINLSDCDSKTVPELKEFLCDLTEDIASDFGIDFSKVKTRTPRSYLSSLFKYFKNTEQKVVVLVDEYDYPVIANITKSSVDKLREVLKNYYAVLKANTNSIHFEFLTGVTRLAYTTIFSGINDVKDISSSEKFSDLLGYTQEELEKYFSSDIENGCSLKGISKDKFLSEIKEWYDGYRFSKKDLSVYNPSSINLFFQEDCTFNTYWITTGTPTFLIDVLSNYSNLKLSEKFSNWYQDFLEDNILIIPNFDILNLLYQSGYITVTDYDTKSNAYKLNYPNREVEKSFNIYLIEAIFKVSTNTLKSYTKDIIDSLEDNNVEGFFK